jgi:serine/threonine protein kinase
MTLERDTLLHKRYRIVESLGQGGMGSVYRAVDENLGVDVAVKENLFTSDEYARQFRLEAVILANLRHPNLPRVSDHFVIGDEGQYLIMDFIEGEDLRQRMERVGLLPEDDVVQIGAAICDALSYLHSRKPPILHRDIKPGNVKITSDGHIYLVDFGLAKVVHGSQATTTGARAMTPGYSPPEQYGTGRTDPRTDIYSLGSTLYAALTGIIPEDGLARAMDNAQLTPLRKRNPKITRRLATVVERAMAIDPADRFQSADDFKKSLLGTKSRTQQLTGTYTIAPPPPDSLGNDGNGSGSEKRIQLEAAAVPDMDNEPFVPPSKRRTQRANRRRMQVLTVILAMLLVGGIFFNINYPGVLLNGLRASMPFLFIETSVVTPTEKPFTQIIPASSPTPLVLKDATPTSTSVLDVDVNLTPTATFQPTPIGADVLQIAFASTREGNVSQIYISDLLGKNIAKITNMPEGACQPSWAPDGKKLVFISPCLNKVDIYPKSSLYIINADGTGLLALQTVPGGDFEPSFSPDGTKIAFTSMRDGPMQVYVYNLSDDSVVRLVNSEPSTAARQPAWSPDGTKIAYSFKRFADVYQIWTMTSSGKKQEQLFRSGDEYSDYLPLWSLDGKMLYFNQRKLGADFSVANLMLYNMNGTEAPRKLSSGLAVTSIENVHISPDGFWLSFESAMGNIQDVYYMTVTGANLTQLAASRKVDFDPVWRPFLTP